jgi:hypothetical protein
MRIRIVHPVLAAALLLQAALALGQAQPPPDPVSEAIREKVDALRYADERAIHGSQVVLREPVARVYEERQFRSAWSDPIRLNELIAAINEVDSDGLTRTIITSMR